MTGHRGQSTNLVIGPGNLPGPILRTCVNLIGNCLATVVVARWEGEFDDDRAKVFGTPAEAELDLKSGDIAFAEAVRQD